MSQGSISMKRTPRRVAMNRIGGKVEYREGGEDASATRR